MQIGYMGLSQLSKRVFCVCIQSSENTKWLASEGRESDFSDRSVISLFFQVLISYFSFRFFPEVNITTKNRLI